MNIDELEKVIEQELLNEIKFVGEDDHTYRGTPQKLIRAIAEAILPFISSAYDDGYNDAMRQAWVVEARGDER